MAMEQKWEGEQEEVTGVGGRRTWPWNSSGRGNKRR